MPHEPLFEYDVFISYSSKDKVWVRGELLKRLENAGLTVFIDFRDFTRGAPSIREMERGVTKSRKTLLILTPAYIASEWCEIEHIMSSTLGPANRDLRMIPLLKAECDRPLRIATLTYIDFTDDLYMDLAWNQLIKALGAQWERELNPYPNHKDWCLAHPYAMPPNFTGRLGERTRLSGWLQGSSEKPLLIVRALGGFGKSALVWHWLTQEVKSDVWARVVWWSFYEGDASFDGFIGRTLKYLSNGEIDCPAQVTPQHVDTLIKELKHPGTLLVLDGFERALRIFGGIDAAYRGDEVADQEPAQRECVSLLAEHFLKALATLPGLQSKVLLTTRLRPHAVETREGQLLVGCEEMELHQMQPDDAIVFFVAQGVRGTLVEIGQACEHYGHHPLALRLLTGLIVSDFQQPGDIAAAQRLDVSGDLIQRQHHVLEHSYNSLSLARQKLLGHIACFRWPVDYNTLKTAAESAFALDHDLHDLVKRGLLHHDTKAHRFDLHPIVRHYAYERLTAPDRTAVHTRLRDYFAAVPQVEKATRLEDLAPVIELYHHTVCANRLEEAVVLFNDRLYKSLFYQFGTYSLIIQLLRPVFEYGEDAVPRLKNESRQAWVLNALANCYSLSGQPRRAVSLFEQDIAILEKLGLGIVMPVPLVNVAQGQLVVGSLKSAEVNLRRSIALCRESGDQRSKAIGNQELGLLLAYRGAYAGSKAEFVTTLRIIDQQNYTILRGDNWAYRAIREILLLRTAVSHDPSIAVTAARNALEFTSEWELANYPIERQNIQAHWLLGAACRAARQYDEAGHHLSEALERCRRINLIDKEANILVDLARLRAVTGDQMEARRLGEESLYITERSGYVLQGADAHLELARIALVNNDKVTAKHHAQQAEKLAYCEGPPDYTYKAAYDEALVLLKQMR